MDILAEYRDTKAKQPNSIELSLLRKKHFTIQAVTRDLEGNFQFNTAISRIMELVNQTYKSLEENKLSKSILKDTIDTIFLLLATFIPHVSEEANAFLGHKESIFMRDWPECDPQYLKEEEIEIAVLVNGKVKDRLRVKTEWSQDEIKTKALSQEKIKAFLKEKKPKKIVYVSNRLVNIVL